MPQIMQQGQSGRTWENNILFVTGIMTPIFGYHISKEVISWRIQEINYIINFGKVITC